MGVFGWSTKGSKSGVNVASHSGAASTAEGTPSASAAMAAEPDEHNDRGVSDDGVFLAGVEKSISVVAKDVSGRKSMSERSVAFPTNGLSLAEDSMALTMMRTPRDEEELTSSSQGRGSYERRPVLPSREAQEDRPKLQGRASRASRAADRPSLQSRLSRRSELRAPLDSVRNAIKTTLSTTGGGLSSAASRLSTTSKAAALNRLSSIQVRKFHKSPERATRSSEKPSGGASSRWSRSAPRVWGNFRFSTSLGAFGAEQTGLDGHELADDLVQRLPLLSAMPSSMQIRVLAAFEAEDYERGDVVLKRGGLNDRCYFVTEGEFAVHPIQFVKLQKWRYCIPSFGISHGASAALAKVKALLHVGLQCVFIQQRSQKKSLTTGNVETTCRFHRSSFS